MTVYEVQSDSDTGVVIGDGDTVILAAGVSVIDPSVGDRSREGLDVYAGIQDGDGGHNRVAILGTAEGFMGVYLTLGSNVVTVGDGGFAYGYNAGVEFHDGGHDLLAVRAGGEVSSTCYAVWFGAYPHYDYRSLPDSGFDAIHNAGLIEGDRRSAVRMVLGGNHIANSGTIQANLLDAIDIDSAGADARNAIVNTGTITAGSRGIAILGGDAVLAVRNDGAISGDIQFGAGADRYAGTGTIAGTVFGSGGNDYLAAGAGATVVCGGAGADRLVSGVDATTFRYDAVSDSTKGTAVDTIDGFDFAKDHILVDGAEIASFDRIAAYRELQAGHAALIQTANGGWYLAIDANGHAGYQAGEDILIHLTHAVDVI